MVRDSKWERRNKVDGNGIPDVQGDEKRRERF